MSCMYNSTIPPWAMMGPSMPIPPNSDPTWEKAMKFYERLQRRQLKKELKAEEERKKKDKNPKKLRDFTFFETFAIVSLTTLWLGPIVSYFQKFYLEMMLR